MYDNLLLDTIYTFAYSMLFFLTYYQKPLQNIMNFKNDYNHLEYIQKHKHIINIRIKIMM